MRKRIATRMLIIFGVLCGSMFAQAAAAQTDDVRARIPWLDEDLARALKAFGDAKPSEQAAAFRAILKVLPKASAPTAGGDVLYLLEGDLPSALDDVCAWVQRLTGTVPPQEVCPRTDDDAPRAASPRPTGAELKELQISFSRKCKGKSGVGDACIWSQSDRKHLTYWIDVESFKNAKVSPGALDDFKNELTKAIADWITPCGGCGLKIEPATKRKANDRLQFVVKYSVSLRTCAWGQAFLPYAGPRYDAEGRQDVSGSYEFQVGRLLFAYLPAALRDGGPGAADEPLKLCSKLTEGQIVDWKTQLAHTLRHEIGHILGYSHEQLSKEAMDKCAKDIADPRPAERTEDVGEGYDKMSIMHSTGCYYAAEAGKPGSHFVITGELSPLDRRGHRNTYRR